MKNELPKIIVLAFYTVIFGYQAFEVWFQYPKFQNKLLEQNRKNIQKGIPFARWAYNWVSKNSFKWLVRATSAIGFLMPFLVLLYVILGGD